METNDIFLRIGLVCLSAAGGLIIVSLVVTVAMLPEILDSITKALRRRRRNRKDK